MEDHTSCNNAVYRLVPSLRPLLATILIPCYASSSTKEPPVGEYRLSTNELLQIEKEDGDWLTIYSPTLQKHFFLRSRIASIQLLERVVPEKDLPDICECIWRPGMELNEHDVEAMPQVKEALSDWKKTQMGKLITKVAVIPVEVKVRPRSKLRRPSQRRSE